MVLRLSALNVLAGNWLGSPIVGDLGGVTDRLMADVLAAVCRSAGSVPWH